MTSAEAVRNDSLTAALVSPQPILVGIIVYGYT